MVDENEHVGRGDPSDVEVVVIKLGMVIWTHGDPVPCFMYNTLGLLGNQIMVFQEAPPFRFNFRHDMTMLQRTCIIPGMTTDDASIIALVYACVEITEIDAGEYVKGTPLSRSKERGSGVHDPIVFHLKRGKEEGGQE